MEIIQRKFMNVRGSFENKILNEIEIVGNCVRSQPTLNLIVKLIDGSQHT